MIPDDVFQLTSENLSNLGGPMGTERTYINWTRHFTNKRSAIAAAEKDYGGPINWIEADAFKTRSPDLGHVMYHVRLLTVEE